MCPGCYRPNFDTYCTRCRAMLFDSIKIPHVLSFDTPKAHNLPIYQEKTKRLSISGVQLKYSLHIKEKQLELTETGGRYILKPVPSTALIVRADQAPENEHLTMQIASQVFGIQTAANALIFFKDVAPAYITRRFDVKEDGARYLQEDMAQISGRTRHTAGENFKYEGSYEEIGHLINRHVAAAPLALENYFKIVLFNYMFSNGDAHMKNFSLIQTDMGDYALTPAYDLMCTVIHTPMEADTALDLYKGDIDSPFFTQYGFFGQANFRELARRVGIKPVRANRIITQLLGSGDKVLSMIQSSFLSDETKTLYIKAYRDKVVRMGMTGEMIARIINPHFPGVYAPTTEPTRLQFMDKSEMVGYFDKTKDSTMLAEDNKFTFVQFDDRHKSDPITIIDADLLTGVEYPSKA